jgi:hypothetical protein
VAEELLQHETILGQRVREILAETQKAPAPTTVAEG